MSFLKQPWHKTIISLFNQKLLCKTRKYKSYFTNYLLFVFSPAHLCLCVCVCNCFQHNSTLMRQRGVDNSHRENNEETRSYCCNKEKISSKCQNLTWCVATSRVWPRGPSLGSSNISLKTQTRPGGNEVLTLRFQSLRVCTFWMVPSIFPAVSILPLSSIVFSPKRELNSARKKGMWSSAWEEFSTLISS